MDREQVKALLDKFYEGTATPEEERHLRQFLLGDRVPEEFAADREFFLAVEEAGGEEPPAAFTRRMEELIDEHYNGTAGRTISLRRWLWRTLPVAASLMLVLATYFFLLSREPQDTYQDPQLAYQETKKVLLYVSRKFNQGAGKLSYLQEVSVPVKEMKKVGSTVERMEKIPCLHLQTITGNGEEAGKNRTNETDTNQNQ